VLSKGLLDRNNTNVINSEIVEVRFDCHNDETTKQIFKGLEASFEGFFEGSCPWVWRGADTRQRMARGMLRASGAALFATRPGLQFHELLHYDFQQLTIWKARNWVAGELEPERGEVPIAIL
jgi:hypothetical protein